MMKPPRATTITKRQPTQQAKTVLKLTLFALLTALAGMGAPALARAHASLVLNHGHVVTLWPQKPHAEAIAIRGTTILAVGRNSQMARYIGRNTKVINLHGRTLTPGFINGRSRLLAVGKTLLSLNLDALDSWQAIDARIKQRVAHAFPGQWIIAHNWHESVRPQPAKPAQKGARSTLDVIAAHHPVVLLGADDHALFANRAALKAAGITRHTKTDSDGDIVTAKVTQKDESQKSIVTGVIRGDAQHLVRQAIQHWKTHLNTKQQLALHRQALALASHRALTRGFTSVVTTSSPAVIRHLFVPRAQAGKLALRLYVAIDADHAALSPRTARSLRHQRSGRNQRLNVNAIAASPRKAHNAKKTAALTHVSQLAQQAKRLNMAFYMRGGDSTTSRLLDMTAKVLGHNAPHKRWRISHVGQPTPDDTARFGQLGVIVGARSAQACRQSNASKPAPLAWQSFITLGAMISNSVNLTRADNNVAQAIHCVLAHQSDLSDTKQALVAQQVLKSFTLWNAYSVFAARHIGSLRPGKMADVTVLSAGYLHPDDGDAARAAQVDYTVVGGKIAYQRHKNDK